MVMGSGGFNLVGNGIRSTAQVEGSLSAIRGAVLIPVAAGPSLAAGLKRSMFVDKIGQVSGSGGLTLVNGDANLVDGKCPGGIGLELHGMGLLMHLSDYSAVLSAAQVEVMATNTWVEAVIGNSRVDLGLLGDWLGPFGNASQLPNNVVFRKFGWQWGPPSPIKLEPGTPFQIDFTVMRAQTTILTASKDIVIRSIIPCRTRSQGVQAVAVR